MASENLTLGKGELWFSPYKTGTQIGEGLEFLGNCPTFSLTAETTKLDHYGSTRGIREKDNSVTLEKTVTGSIVTDDIKPENIARFIGGSASTLTVASSTGATSAFTDVVQGRRYQLGVTTNTPTGARNVSNVVVETGATTHVANTDYIVHAELGMVEIVVGGGIENGDDIEVTFDIAASTRSLVVSSVNDIEGELKFISYNAEGPLVDYFMPRVKLTPNGDFQIISEEWTTISWNVEVLTRGSQAQVYCDGRPVVA